MLNEIIMLANQILNETEVGVKCFGVEAVSLRTGEVEFDFFGDYEIPVFRDGKIVKERLDSIQSALGKYPLKSFSVTFYGIGWAKQQIMRNMIEKLDELEERAAYWQEQLDNTPDGEHEHWRAEKHADLAFGNAFTYAEKCAETYFRFATTVTKNAALRAVARRAIDYSLIVD